MRVAVLFDNFGPYHLARLSAVSQVCNLLALELNQRSRDYDWEPSLSRKGFRSETLFRRGPKYVSLLSQGRRLSRMLAGFEPDCLFIPGWSRSYSLQALHWARLHRTPAVIMSESAERDLPRHGWKEWLKKAILRRCAAGLVGGSPHAEYLTRLGMNRQAVFLGYDAVDNSYFSRQAERARRLEGKLREEFHLPPHYLLASARFVERKNLAGLLRAFARHRAVVGHGAAGQTSTNNPPPWSLVILGDGPQKPAVQQLIAKLGLSQAVVLPGFKQYAQLPVYYGLADAFVQASTSEPWGLVVNEAMASGLAVLVSNRCGCAADLICEGANGFTFDPQDIEQLAALMSRLWRRPSRRAAMGRASHRVISNWGLDRFVRGFRDAAQMAVDRCLSATSPEALNSPALRPAP